MISKASRVAIAFWIYLSNALIQEGIISLNTRSSHHVLPTKEQKAMIPLDKMQDSNKGQMDDLKCCTAYFTEFSVTNITF